MSWDGMLPYGLKCTKCGAVLGGLRSGEAPYYEYDRPAELYAGTHTGLCYRCERSEPYVETVEWDGAQIISYPPHCPSWRRSRETFIAYADCADCDGTGRHYVSRSMGEGGSYYRYCESCMKRYSANEHRVRWASWHIRPGTYQERFMAELKALMGVKGKRAPLPDIATWPADKLKRKNEIADRLIAEFKAEAAAVEAKIAAERAVLEKTAQIASITPTTV